MLRHRARRRLGRQRPAADLLTVGESLLPAPAQRAGAALPLLRRQNLLPAVGEAVACAAWIAALPERVGCTAHGLLHPESLLRQRAAHYDPQALRIHAEKGS